jgi:AmmeMemoRadiSam system protein B/AmmeMemoRadiSam system protein A
MNKKFLFLLAIICVMILSGCVNQEKEMVVKEPNVAGSFYPSERGVLETMISEYMNKSELKVSGVRGLVSPHAGYEYSGPVAANGYKQIEGKTYRTVIIIGPSHYVGFRGFSIPNATHYKTPLGIVKISEKVIKMGNENGFVSDGKIHEKEHSVEVQIPFLQKALNDFEIIPIVVGEINPETLADILMRYIDENTLIIASSDLSHYYPYEEAKSLDSFCINSIPNLDFNGMKNCEACGSIPIMTLMYIAKKSGWSGELLDYRNSGDTTGDKSRVVGYASIAFYKEEGVKGEDQKYLLGLARQILESYLNNGTIPQEREDFLSHDLLNVQGCFVTLNKMGNLRGCIGHILPVESLYKCVIDNAVNAAVHDTRFIPVTKDELKDIKIEISVLTVPRVLEHKSPEDLLQKLRPGIDGVVIRYGLHQSTYLPQVWDQLPEKNNFMESLCIKGGSQPDCWRDNNAVISTYQAQVFGEE